MTRKTKRAVFVGALTAIALGLWVFWQREPEWQDRSLTHWLALGTDVSVIAVREIGTDALPMLLSKVATRETLLQQATHSLNNQLSRRRRISLISPEQSRREGVFGFYAMGSAGASAIPDLKGLLESRSPGVRAAAAHSLGCIGTPALSATNALVLLLSDESAEVSESAALALGRLGSHSNDVIEILDDLFASESSPIHWPVGLALSEAGPSAAASVPTLMKGLSSPDYMEFAGAAKGLGGIGKPAKVAIPTLLGHLSSTDSRRVWAVIEALGSLGKDARTAAPSLLQKLKSLDPVSPETGLRSLLVRSLKRIAPETFATRAPETRPRPTHQDEAVSQEERERRANLDSDKFYNPRRGIADAEYAKRVRQHNAIAQYLNAPRRGHPSYEQVLLTLLRNGYDITLWAEACSGIIDWQIPLTMRRNLLREQGYPEAEVERRLQGLVAELEREFESAKRRLGRHLGISESKLLEELLAISLPLVNDEVPFGSSIDARVGDRLLVDRDWMTAEHKAAASSYNGRPRPKLHMVERQALYKRLTSEVTLQ